MNKNQFRIIFNQARGLMMAVAEHVKSHSSGSSSESTSSKINFADIHSATSASSYAVTIRPLVFSILLSLGMVGVVPNPLSISEAQAGGVVADQSAPANQRPMIVPAANGVPVVNIQTPSAAGVSRNTYSQFDVDSQGLILNNSRTNVQTQLGGYVQGNPYMAAGTARVILNEVNSSNPSLLNGYVEVAGSRAQVVVANPAGISCDGCGFINANRVTLTTGTPIINSGNLMGYRVTGGVINFLGTGLDTSQTNYTDIIARAVNVNAGLFANNLNIVTGPNQVNVASTGDISSIVPIAGSGPVPTVALDVAALGGMYAGKIHLIGTEAGLGVRNAGTIGASVGEVTIDVNGQLTNTGNITSNQQIQIQAAQNLDNSGLIYSQGDTILSTQGDLNNTGTIAAKGNTSLDANGVNSNISSSANSVLAAGLNTDGSFGNSGNLTVNASQSITALGQNLSGQDQTLNAQSLDISGSQTLGQNLTFTASNGSLDASNASISASNNLTANTTQTLRTDGAAISANQLNVTANDISNISGELIQTGAGDTAINLAGNLNNTQGRIAVNSANLTLGAHTLTNTSGSIEHAGNGNLIITATTLDGSGGLIQSNGALNLTATNNATLDGGSTIAKQISIDTGILNNIGGEIIQTGTNDTSISATTQFDNTGGMLSSNGDTTLAVGNLINKGGVIQSAGGANLTITAAGALDNSVLNGVSGSIQATGAATLTANNLDNNQGQITAGQTLTAVITQNTDNNQGLIAANQDVTTTAGSIDNSQGTIASVQASITATATTGAINNTAGQIEAAQDITIATLSNNGSLTNTDGYISGSNVSLDSHSQALDNTRGNIAALGALNLQSGQLTNDAGLIQATGDITLNTHGQTLTNTNSGVTNGIVGQSTVTLTTGDLDNQGGFIGAQGNLTANSAAITNTQGGVLTSESDISLTGTSLDNTGGQVQALGNVTVNAGNGTVDNTGSLVRAGQTLSITAGNVINANTQGTNQGLEGQNVAINADQINNTIGAIRADDALTITGHGAVNNSQGLISSSNTVVITDSNLIAKAQAITNTGGTIIANTDLQIDSASLTGDGNVLSKGNLTAKLTSDFNNSGEFQADGNATLETTGTLTNQASLAAGNILTLTAATLDNQATGQIVADQLNLTATDTHTLINRGLIDGSDTFINTATLNNIGTGRIYGDHVAIAATTLTNDTETVNGVTSAAVIAARDRLDIGATTITNREHGLIFSAGDMAIGGSLDANHEATVATGTAQATTLNNNSATIEALGNLYLNVATINNTNEHFTTEYSTVSESTTPARAVDVRGLSYSPAPAPGNTRTYQLSYFSTDGALVFGPTYNYDQVDFYTPGFVHIVLNSGVPGASYTDPISGSNRDFVTFMEYNTGIIVNETHVVTTDPGQILSGGSATINATNLLNDNSKIIAGGALNANVTNLDNRETAGTRSSWTTSESAFFRSRESCNCSRYFQGLGDSAPVIETFNLGSSTYLGNTAYAGTGTQITTLSTNSVNLTATGANNANVSLNTNSITGTAIQITSLPTNSGSGPATVVNTVTPNTTLSNNSLFHTNPNPTSNFFVETDPRFANYRTWLSSDYMLNALSYDPATQIKRLGDGFYEQKLVREQIAQLTGRRYLDGYASDEAEYQALMTNGVTFAQTYHLVPGVALTEAQMAQLTSDIVWLVQKTITLADGSTVAALVPQVYAKLQQGDVDGSGSLLSGDSVNLTITGDLTNGGTIAGRHVVSLTADNINNLSGHIVGDSVTLKAHTDINNIGGTIKAADALTLNAARDINVISTTLSNQKSYDVAQANKTIHVDVSRTNIDRVAGLYVTNPNGILVANADNNINLQGAAISNSGSNGKTEINAGGDLNLSTVATASENSYVRNAKNYVKNGGTEEVGTVIQTDSDITLTANRDVTARAATVTSSDSAIEVTADRDINIEAGEATSHAESASYKKSSGFLSSKSKTTRDTMNSTTAESSTFSGDSISLNAGTTATTGTAGTLGNINVNGSSVVATNNVDLNATGDISITAAQDTHDETHYKKVKQSGLSTSGASVTLGNSKLTNTNDSQQVTNVASTVGSITGDVNISAGKDVKVTGSDLIAGQDINVTGQNVTLDAAYDTQDTQQTTNFKQSGISLGLTGPVITAIQAATASAERSEEVKDDKLKAVYELRAALNAAKAATEVLDAVNSDNPTATSGVQLSLSIGTSKSSSSSTSHDSVARGDSLTAARDINVTAIGTQGNGNITMVGVDGNAGRDINLSATNDINLLSAVNDSDQHSKSKNSSAAVGVAIGATQEGGAGISVFANASAGKGKTNGNAVSHTETTLKAGDTLSLESGHDTTLKGAIVSGNTVIADIGTNPDTGGNLRLESEQDSANYNSKKSSISGGVSYTFGAGGFGGSISSGKEKIDSTYNSVIEQTAIQAGNGGFDINVAGNTHLKGAVIDSTLAAQVAGNNQLTTATLTTENIENKGEYKASSSTIGVSVNGSPNTGTDNPAGGSIGSSLKPGLNGMGVADSGEEHGTTKAAIANADITITDDTAQKALTGKDAVTTIATLDRDTQHANGSIENPFNLEKVQEQLEFLQVAGETIVVPAMAQAAKWIGDQFPPDPEHPDRIDPAKVLAHAALGAAVSQLLGTGWQTGAAAGALGDVLPQVLAKAFEKDENGKIKDEAAFKAASAIISALLASGSGADLAQTINAAMITQNAVENNWLKHQEKLDLARFKQDCAANNQEACRNAAKLEILDKLRNKELLNACVNLSAEACATQLNLDPAAKAYFVDSFYTIGFGRVIAQFGENAQKAAPPPQLVDITLDLMPIIGDVKGFAEAESPFDYTIAIIGVLGPVGDAAKALVKEAKLLNEAGDTVAAAEKLDAAQLLVANAARGKAFEDGVLTALNLPKNTERIPVLLPGGKAITVIPDALGKTIIEVKDVKYLSMSNQFRGYLTMGKPVDLVVSPGTRISGPLEAQIRSNPDSTIKIFDPITKTFSNWKS